MDKIKVAAIGAGVIGLSIAAELSRRNSSVYLLERHETFGMETSSRNSEVIHAGLYYPKDSLKTITCIEGNSLIYKICRDNNIHHRKSGKLIVAQSKSEITELEMLFENGLANGVEELRLLTKDEAKALEPNVESEGAIYSGTTGIVDSHELMNFYAHKATQNGAIIAYKTDIKRILRKAGEGYEVTVVDSENAEFKFIAETVINCAGLQSDIIAQMAGIDIRKKGYQLRYCKGQYFKVNGKKSRLVNRLVYPVPKGASGTLGIHATPNLAGVVRLGPDDEYVDRDNVDYSVDSSARKRFHDSVVTFLPFLEEDDLSQDTSGIRPKLQTDNGLFRDFIVKEEADIGLPGFINLIGIESPGLTAAPSIARIVSSMVSSL